jgi:hypothetical protein
MTSEIQVQAWDIHIHGAALYQLYIYVSTYNSNYVNFLKYYFADRRMI